MPRQLPGWFIFDTRPEVISPPLKFACTLRRLHLVNSMGYKIALTLIAGYLKRVYTFFNTMNPGKFAIEHS